MHIEVYDIINDPLPQLYLINTIEIDDGYISDDKQIVDIFNNYLKMNKLSSEHIYALSLTYGFIPKGIIQVSVGKADKCELNEKILATGLLLTGAEQFICLHNHPGGVKDVSSLDVKLTMEYKKIGELIGIDFLRHIMITQDFCTYCDEEDDLDIPFN